MFLLEPVCEGFAHAPARKGAAVRRLVVALVCLLLLGGAFPAAGEIYQWWDEQGKLHLSQDLNQVPSGPRTSTISAAAWTR